MARKPLEPWRQHLAERYVSLARSMSRPYKQRFPRLTHEFESAAYLAVVQVAESFDPKRKIRFATFARHRIRGALRDVQRTLVPLGYRQGKGQRPGIGNVQANIERKHPIVRGISRFPAPDAELEMRDDLEIWLGNLLPYQAEVCRMLFVEGLSQTEAGRRLKIGQSRVSLIFSEVRDFFYGYRDAC